MTSNNSLLLKEDASWIAELLAKLFYPRVTGDMQRYEDKIGNIKSVSNYQPQQHCTQAHKGTVISQKAQHCGVSWSKCPHDINIVGWSLCM